MLLAYPDGRLRRRAQRRVVGRGYALAIIGPLPFLLFADADALRRLPARRVIQVADDHDARATSSTR